MTRYRVETRGGSECEVDATSFEDAAKESCDRIWGDSAGEAFDVGGEPTELIVTELPDGEVRLFNASAEASITYWVTETVRSDR